MIVNECTLEYIGNNHFYVNATLSLIHGSLSFILSIKLYFRLDEIDLTMILDTMIKMCLSCNKCCKTKDSESKKMQIKLSWMDIDWKKYENIKTV